MADTNLYTGNVREREDLQKQIDVLFGDLKYYGMLNALPGKLEVKAQKHEWIEDASRAETLSCTASGGGADWDTVNDITALPVATAQITKLRVGDVLRLPTGPEVVIVKSIDVAGQTIDLIERGHGSTSGTAQGAVAFTVTIIGHAAKEDQDAGYTDFVTPTEAYNYTQIFHDIAGETATLRASETITSQDELDRQIAIKLTDLLKRLNKAMIFGYRNLDTTNHIATMNGFRQIATATVAAGGALSKALFNQLFRTIVTAGASSNRAAILPLNQYDRLIQLFEPQTIPEVGGKVAGFAPVTIISAVGPVKLYPDLHMLTTEILALDLNRIDYGPLKSKNGSEAFYATDATTPGSRVLKKALWGEYTLEVRQPASHGIMTGLTA
jgi:hypothetical protein